MYSTQQLFHDFHVSLPTFREIHSTLIFIGLFLIRGEFVIILLAMNSIALNLLLLLSFF